MILADTSIWIDHFRNHNATLANLLSAEKVKIHPLVIGELIAGNLPRRESLLSDLNDLEQVKPLPDHDIVYFINENKLFGKGVGYADFSLLVSCLVYDVPLLTIDKRLRNMAQKFDISFD